MDHPKMIFIGSENLEDISEESAHFLHYVHTNMRFSNKSRTDRLALHTIDEMLAFFCSKLVFPQRKNPYPKNPDLFFMTPVQRQEFLEGIRKKHGEVIAGEFYLYQQARGIGEGLWKSFQRGDTLLEDIKNLLFCDFEEDFSPSFQVVNLKREYYWGE